MNNKDHFILDDETIISKSESTLRQEAQQNPEDSRALNNLGSYLSCQGNVKEAQELFERAWRMAPTNDGIGYNLAVVMMKKFNFTRALEILMELKLSVDLEPNVRLQIGTCLLALHRYQEAVSYLSQASEQLSNNKKAYFNLFKAASRANNHAVARRAKSAYVKLVEDESLRSELSI